MKDCPASMTAAVTEATTRVVADPSRSRFPKAIASATPSGANASDRVANWSSALYRLPH
nr:hypothetical protein [Tautonia plasticadhaerens]